MTDQGKKKIFERPLIVFVLTFVSLAVVLAILAMIEGKGSPLVIGTYFLYGGISVGIVGFLFLNKGGTLERDSDSQSLYRNNIEYFKKKRSEEKPLERVILPVIFAAASLAAVGYFLGRFLVD
jgi:hypothetical protein